MPALPDYILTTRLVVPARPRNLVRRERLLAALHENIDRRLILISAPPGFGKTSLLIDFAHDTTLPICWYSVDEAHGDERLFLEYLTASILRRFPKFGRGRMRQWMGNPSRAWDRLGFLTALVNDLQERVRDYFVLIIDDFHLVENDEAITRSLDWLLKRAGDNFCLILSSRGLPELDFLHLTAKGQVFGLGAEDLRFTPQEIQEFYAQNFSVRLPDEEARRLAEVSEGWITALRLSSQRVWRGTLESLATAKTRGGLLFDYLAKEVLDAQEAEVREFLLRSSVLPDLSASLCSEVLQISEPAKLFALIERRNLFVTLVDEEERVYHYHHLFREFLKQSLRSREPRVWKGLHLRAAQALASRGRWEETLPYLLEARAFEDAAKIMEEIAPRALREGRLATLARWIDALPKRVFSSHPFLLLDRSAVAIDTGDLPTAHGLSQKALRRFLHSREPRGTARALIQLATIERAKGNLAKSVSLAQKALKVCQEELRDAYWEAQALRAIGIAYGIMGNLPQSITSLRRALELYRREGDEASAAYVATSLGTALRREGQLAESDKYYYQALETWQRLGNSTEETHLLNNLAVGHYYEGDYREALEQFEEALAKSIAASVPAAEVLVLAGMADVFRELGRLDEAQEKYEQALSLARKIEDKSLLLYATDGMAEVHRQEGDLAGARSYLHRAWELAKPSTSRLDKARVYITAGLVAADSGQLVEAKRSLLEAKKITEEAGAEGELARTLFALATCELASGQVEEAKAHLRISLESARTRRIEYFLLNPRAKGSLQFAASQDIMADYVAELLSRIETLPTLPVAEKEVAKTIRIESRLEVWALGGGRVSLNRRIVPKGTWVGRLPRELFFLLMDRGAQTRDQIGLVFWPDISPERLKYIFHVTLLRLRKALPGEWIIRDPVRNVYQFNQELDYWYDVEAFERALAAARRRRNEPQAALSEYRAAIGLYGGDFLPEVDAEWADLRRESLAQAFVDALVGAAEMLLGLNEASPAAEYLLKALEREPYREDILRKAMATLAMAGQRSRALKIYEEWNQRMQTELNMGLEAETLRLAQELRQGQGKGKA